MSSSSLGVKGTKKEHWTQRVPRQLREQRKENQTIWEVLERMGMKAQVENEMGKTSLPSSYSVVVLSVNGDDNEGGGREEDKDGSDHPNDDPDEDPDDDDSHHMPHFTVVVKFQEQEHLFHFKEPETIVFNLLFRTSGRLNLPWFQLTFEVDGRQLGEYDELMDFASEVADEDLGFIVNVDLFHYDDAGLQNSVAVIVLEQFGQRRQFNLEMSNFNYDIIKDYVRDYLTEVLQLERHDIHLRYNDLGTEAVADNAEPLAGQELSMRLFIVGEGGVLRGGSRPMNQEQVLKSFLKNSRAIYHKRVEDREDEVSDTAPVFIQPMLTSIKEQIVRMKVRTSTGDNIIKMVLEQVEDSHLQNIKSVLELRDGKTSEEKLATVSELLWREVGLVKDSIPHLHNAKVEMTELLLEEFGRHYHRLKGGALNYSLEKVVRDIDTVMNLRMGQRQALSRAEANEDTQVSDNSCVLM